MKHAYIYDAVRTPRGKGRAPTADKPGGGLSSFGPQDLIAQLVEALEGRNGEHAIASVKRLILGCVGQVGAQGGHIALVSKLTSKLDNSAAAKTINNYCVSGLTAINEAAAWGLAGAEGLSLAGGVEMLSRVPFLADKGDYYANPELATRLEYLAPIMGAELVATQEGYTKQNMDDITYRSHQKAHAAWEAGKYDAGVIPIKTPDGEIASARDEWIRPDLSIEKLNAIPPSFAELGRRGADAIMLKHFPELGEISHVHSVSTTPGMSDGAALALIGSKEVGEAVGLTPKAKILASVEVGGDPILQFGAGFQAMEDALKLAGVTLEDLDLIEFMEAFASVPLKFERNYAPDLDKVNVNGGHLAMGHPMGATGAILTTTLLHEMERRDVELGLVVASAANGIGSAMVISRAI